ncbi:MAG: hypothetical protein ACTSV7_06850 [Candidatus Baldrarchaeia archaeon]
MDKNMLKKRISELEKEERRLTGELAQLEQRKSTLIQQILSIRGGIAELRKLLEK